MTDEQRSTGDSLGLPRPEMWPAGATDTPFTGIEDQEPDDSAPARPHLAWVAVGLMIAGAVLVGLAVALRSWVPLVAGVVVGVTGLVLALRAKIFQDVSLSA
jgi:hypothetical protein